MPKPFEMGHLEEIKAELKRRAEAQQQQAEAAYKEFVETPSASKQTQASDSIVYAELALKPAQRPFEKTSAKESTTIYSEVLGDSGEEKVRSQVAILKDQKKQSLEKLNQAISENKKDAIDAYRSELSAIEVSMASKINHLKRNKISSLGQSEEFHKSNAPETHEEVDLATVTVAKDGTRGITFESQPDQKAEKISLKSNESGQKINFFALIEARKQEILKKWQEPFPKTEVQQTQEVSLDQEDTHLQGPAVDRTKKPAISSEVELVEERQNKSFREKRVQFTQITLERDKSKEQENLLSKQPSREVVKPTPVTTSLQTTLKEPSTVSQSTSEPNLIANPAPPVDRKLKPRLAQSNFFSSPNFFSEDQSDQKAKKEKATGGVVYRQ